VTAAGRVKRGGEHNNQPKEGRAGRRAPKQKDGNVSEGGGDGDCGGEGVGGGVVRSEATAAMTTTTTTMSTTTSTMMTAADTLVEDVAMVTAEARAMVAAMAKEGGSVGRYVRQGEKGL
jgi:hypothetical protein